MCTLKNIFTLSAVFAMLAAPAAFFQVYPIPRIEIAPAVAAIQRTARPSVTITKPPLTKSSLMKQQVEFVGSPAAYIKEYRCSLDDSPYTLCSSPHTVSVTQIGAHVFRVRSYDLWQRSSLPAEAKFEVTAPASTPVAKPIKATFYNLQKKTSFVITGTEFKVLESDAAAFSICADNVEAPVTFTSPLGTQTENIAPFCIQGDDGAQPRAAKLGVGKHTITIADPSHANPLKLTMTVEASLSAGNDDSTPRVDESRIPKGSAGYSYERVKSTTQSPVPSEIGAFRIACAFSHMNFDDMIVHPNKLRASHLHAYFGNTDTTATSTPTSLLESGNSTCDGGIVNRSSYWVPAVIDTRSGAPIAPKSNGVYYKQGYHDIPLPSFKKIPNGLRMIAGNSTNASSDYPYARWDCLKSDGTVTNWKSIPTDCPAGSTVLMILIFPQCWDGKNLDSPDHKSHMAYPTNGTDGKTCPSSHPTPVPVVSFNVYYSVKAGDDTSKWRLASDAYSTSLPGGYSIHGDVVIAWKEEIKYKWHKNCILARKDCHAYLLGDGLMIY